MLTEKSPKQKVFEFELHCDPNWEKLYRNDEEYLNKEKLIHYLIFKDKTYVLLKKHILISEYFSNHLNLNSNHQYVTLNLKYCNDPIAFDYFMKILYIDTHRELTKVLLNRSCY